MAQTQLWTFQDAVENLLDQQEVERVGLNYRNARRACIEAMRQLQAYHDWTVYRQVFTLQTSASQSSSTVTYDHTGGAYERMLTIASGTWPTWAAFGMIVIAGEHYHVEDYKSSTIITLTANSNPGSDLAAGTTYEIYRSTYPLPVNFRKVIQVVDTEQQRQVGQLLDSEQHYLSRTVCQDADTPWHFTIRGDQEYYGSLSLIFTPPPSTARYYDIYYIRTARDLVIDKYATGTVAVSAGSTTVTGTSTAFPEDCVGSIIRFSETSTAPTGIPGTFNGSTPIDNRYFAQRVITAWGSATSLTIDQAVHASTALSGDAYTISDPLDIEYHAMYGAFMALAEAEFFKLAGRKDWQDRASLARQRVLEAIETDSRAASAPLRVPYDPFIHTTLSSE